MPTVCVNGINVYYEVHGEGAPLLLIAGLGTDISLYGTTIRRLSQKYRVVAFDNRGVGRSDKPDSPYTIEMMAEDAAGLLKSLDVTKTNVLGISMGGRIALGLALQHPELVSSLILVSTCARVTWRPGRFRLFKLIKRIRAAGRILGRSPQPYYAFLRQLEASGSYDCVDRLGEITVPTLIMNGRKDKLAPPELAEEMHAGIKGSKMVSFDGGHLFFVWKNERFTDSLVGFLTSIGAAPRPSGR